MSETPAVETQPETAPQPSRKQKITLSVAQIGAGLLVTIVAGVVTDRLNKQLDALIIPKQEG